MNQPFDIKSISGLTDAQAAHRLKKDGYNELPSTKSRSIWNLAWDVIQEPMFLLLIACGAIYLILGNLEESLVLLGSVFIIMGITFYQERKTERALEALRDLSSPRALVIRGGKEMRIPGREVVRGDIVIVKEGDRVPADAVLLSSTNLSADESLLTGESVPVRKSIGHESMTMIRPGGDDIPFIYSSTLIVQGHGVAQVLETGIQTEIGKIGKALQTIKPEETTLQKETGRMVRILATWGIALCALVVIIYGLTRHDWIRGFLAGLTAAMSILPEEFPVVLTVFLALGAWRISQKRVLTRRTPAIEMLGAATVLCVDKTGTLTENQMTVSQIFVEDELLSLSKSHKKAFPEKFHELIEFGVLASQTDPFDPMEKAIHELGNKKLAHTEHLHQDWTLIREYTLSKKLLALSHVWQSPDEKDFIIAAKGAPEAIFDLCHLTKAECEKLEEKVLQMANEGLRVLGVAKARFHAKDLPREQHDFKFEFIGLLGLADPVRDSVPPAIKECYSAGVRVIMITGDYPGTARNIAKQIGLTHRDNFITGPELDEMSDEALTRRIENVNIFARVVPEQKLRIVQALKAHREIVAMTGDGVNDAPALKAAHIGIAMGGRGTDVARESAALVLLDDDFASIVHAIRLGRRIFDNIKKSIAYLLAVHVPIAGMALLPVIFKWPLVFFPVHILFLELIIDPACSTIFEAETEEPDTMRRPPRSNSEHLFNRSMVLLSILQGLIVLGTVLGIFTFALFTGRGENEARALSYTTLIIANLALILTNRSWEQTIFKSIKKPNAALWWVLGGAAIVLSIVLTVPGVRHLFLFSVLHPIDIALCIGAGLVSIAWFEILKMAHKWHRRRGKRIKS